jgi:CheY-like chemotaxis protein
VPVRLNDIVKRAETLIIRLISEDITFNTVLKDEELSVMADGGQIEQVLMNLATNACDAMPQGGVLTMETGLVEIDSNYIKTYGYGEPGMYAFLSVSDTGEGMDEQTKEKLFEPFFTTKDVGKGTGLGLSIVYGIIKQHNGYINVYSDLGKGTTFRIYLPIIKSAVKEPDKEEAMTAKGGTETLLVAEDAEDVRELLKIVLEDYGYTVIEASDGDEAIERFMERKENIQLLILDVIMPKKIGKEVYDEIRKIRPEMKALFISGYTAEIIHKKGVLEEGLNFISKPVSPPELLEKVREVLDS